MDMGPHRAAGAAPVLGDGGLCVRGRRDHHDIAGLGQSAPGEESQHGVPPGEPHWQGRYFEFDVRLQQRRQRRRVRVFIRVFKGREISVDHFAALQRTVDRRGRGLEKFGNLGRTEPHDVAQDQQPRRRGARNDVELSCT